MIEPNSTAAHVFEELGGHSRTARLAWIYSANLAQLLDAAPLVAGRPEYRTPVHEQIAVKTAHAQMSAANQIVTNTAKAVAPSFWKKIETYGRPIVTVSTLIGLAFVAWRWAIPLLKRLLLTH